MKIYISILLMCLISLVLVNAATVEQFFPWVAPHSVVLGGSNDILLQTRPSAAPFAMEGPKPGVAFTGGMSEILPDESLLIYGFKNGVLHSVMWTTRRSDRIVELLVLVRASILETCSETSFGTTGRIDSAGSIAEIFWESYRPKIDRDYLITLIATSEGVEVMLVNEAAVIASRGDVIPRTYKEVVDKQSSTLSGNVKPSSLVDYLGAIRANTQQSKDAKSESSDRNSTELPLEFPSKASAPDNRNQTSPLLESPEPTKTPSPTWLWLLGVLILGILTFIANALRKHRN